MKLKERIVGRIFKQPKTTPMSNFMIAFGNMKLATKIILDDANQKINELNGTLNLVHLCVKNSFSGNAEAILDEIIRLNKEALGEELE